MVRAGIIGWRGMVGSVLVQRMREERDFDQIEPVFFSTSQAGGKAPEVGKPVEPVKNAMDLAELKKLPVLISCQGGGYTSEIYPKLRREGWKGYWIDAASALRMPRIALGIEYDGSRFLGWQTQPGGGAVQDALEPALSGIAGAPVGVTAAGRTDRGVHARLQVVHFDTDAQRPPSAWVRGVNALLPDAVAVLWSREVDGEFHARYSAISRTYRYELLNRDVRPGLGAARLGWFHLPLDLAKMREAAAHLVGEHDFSAFRSSECQAKTPVRTLHALEIEARGARIDFVLRANAFLHHMIVDRRQLRDKLHSLLSLLRGMPADSAA